MKAHTESETLAELHHQIANVSISLLMMLNRHVRQLNSVPGSITDEQLTKLLDSSIFHVRKIEDAVRLAGMHGIDTASNWTRQDLIGFIGHYLTKFQDLPFGWGMKVDFTNDAGAALVRGFRPTDISMLIDNLIDNAGRAEAKTLRVTTGLLPDEKEVVISFIDDGKGLPDGHDPDSLLDLGVTTGGSGIGLHHVCQIAGNLSADVSIADRTDGESGAVVSIRLRPDPMEPDE